MQIDATDPFKVLNSAILQAKKRGMQKLAEQRADYLAKCLQGGAGKAHNMANADNLLPPLRSVIRETGEENKTNFVTDRCKVTEHHAKPWRAQWNADDPSFAQRLGANFQRLRKRFLPEAAEAARLFDGSATAIRTSLKIFLANTAIGADDLHPRLLADLPDIALEQLGLLFKSAIKNLSLPLQELINLLCLLGKKAGGSRVIAIMCTFYRALMKANGTEIREWDAAHGHMYDSALAGSSSLQAAVLRAF